MRASQPLALLLILGFSSGRSLAAEAPLRVAPDPTRTVFVSKLGDNSGGSSWAKAFKTIQAALNAVPDDRGDFRIVIRPDTYMEVNLYPAHRGAAGAYNELVGDWNGAL